MTRVSANIGDGYKARVTLNGVDVPYCLEADDIEGWARCADMDMPVRDPWWMSDLHPDGQQHIRYGKVEITMEVR